MKRIKGGFLPAHGAARSIVCFITVELRGDVQINKRVFIDYMDQLWERYKLKLSSLLAGKYWTEGAWWKQIWVEIDERWSISMELQNDGEIFSISLELHQNFLDFFRASSEFPRIHSSFIRISLISVELHQNFSDFLRAWSEFPRFSLSFIRISSIFFEFSMKLENCRRIASTRRQICQETVYIWHKSDGICPKSGQIHPRAHISNNSFPIRSNRNCSK